MAGESQEPRRMSPLARRLEADSRTPARLLAVANPLGGIAVCDECGGPLQMHRQKGRGCGVLQCRRARELHLCAGPGAPVLERVEEAVLTAIEAEARGLVDVGVEAERRSKRARAKVDVARLRRELSKTEAALGRSATLYAKQEMTAEEYRAAAASLRSEIERLRAALVDSERGAGAPSSEGLQKAAAALVKRWPRMTAEERNRALRPIVRQVRVRRATSYRQPESERVHVEFW